MWLVHLSESKDGDVATDDLLSILRTVSNLLKSSADEEDVTITVDAAEDVPPIEVAQYQFHRIGFALGMFAIERSRPGSSLTLSVAPEGEGFMIAANVQSGNDLPLMTSVLVQDRALLEHLVAREHGVLSVSETKANGSVRILACFDPSNPPGRSETDIQDAESEVDHGSNVLQLPAASARD